LLKGCEQWFIPVHPRAHYCSPECRKAATRWRRVKGSRAYRASDKGRERRREQNRHYRQRRRAREAATAAEKEVREGKRIAVPSENFAEKMCDRPGCYVLFRAKHEHSSRRFCSVVCRLALRCVLDREARYKWRRERRVNERAAKPVHRPDTS
jgi:hypothetical protein